MEIGKFRHTAHALHHTVNAHRGRIAPCACGAWAITHAEVERANTGSVWCICPAGRLKWVLERQLGCFLTVLVLSFEFQMSHMIIIALHKTQWTKLAILNPPDSWFTRDSCFWRRGSCKRLICVTCVHMCKKITYLTIKIWKELLLCQYRHLQKGEDDDDEKEWNEKKVHALVFP